MITKQFQYLALFQKQCILMSVDRYIHRETIESEPGAYIMPSAHIMADI